MDFDLYLKSLRANADLARWQNLTKSRFTTKLQIQEALYRYQISQTEFTKALYDKRKTAEQVKCDEHAEGIITEVVLDKHYLGLPGKLYCCNQGHCWKSAYSLGAHNQKTGHKKAYNLEKGEDGKYKVVKDYREGGGAVRPQVQDENYQWYDLDMDSATPGTQQDDGSASATPPPAETEDEPKVGAEESEPSSEEEAVNKPAVNTPGNFKDRFLAYNWLQKNMAQRLQIDEMDMDTINGLTAAMARMKKLYPNIPRFNSIEVFHTYNNKEEFIAAVSHEPKTGSTKFLIHQKYARNGEYEKFVTRHKAYNLYKEMYSPGNVNEYMKSVDKKISKLTNAMFSSRSDKKIIEYSDQLKDAERRKLKYQKLLNLIAESRTMEVARPYAAEKWEDAVIHEMGHFLHLNTKHWKYMDYSYAFGKDRLGVEQDVTSHRPDYHSPLTQDMLHQSMKVSNYAMTNGEELLAESWVLFHQGRQAEIPPSVLTVCEDIDSFHRTGQFVHLPNERRAISFND